MENTKILKYVIITEGAKAKTERDLVNYEYTYADTEEYEFETLEEAKAEFEDKFMYHEVNKVMFGYELGIHSLNEQIVTLNEDGIEIDCDNYVLETSKFKFEDEEEYKILKEFVKNEEVESDVLRYNEFDEDYCVLNSYDKENLIYIYEKATENNLLNFVYDIVEEVRNDISDYDFKKDVINRVNELVKDIKENGEITIY